MLATFYNFSKRENSTKQPTLNEVTISGEVCFKQATSLVTPTLIMAVGNEDVDKAISSNYCEVNGKYYYITDKVMVNSSHMSFDCTIDVLASYKADILDTRAYIARSSSHGNFNLADPHVLATASLKCSTSYVSMDDLLMPTDSVGWSIVNVCNAENILTTYLMDSTIMPQFMTKICNPDFMQELSQYMSNPFDYIVSVYQCPFRYSAFNMRDGAIIIGSHLIDDISGALVASDNIAKKHYSLPVPHNYSDFRDVSPITKATLFLPFIGTVDIETNRLKGSDSIDIEVYADIRTGDIIYQLYFTKPNETEVVVRAQAYSGNCYSQMPLARTSNDLKALGQSIIGLASVLLIGGTSIGKSAEAMSGAIPMMAASTGITLSSGIAALEAQTSMKGELSTFLGKCLGNDITLSVWSNVTSCDPSDLTSTIGNPVNNTYVLSELTGYVETIDASVSCSGTLGEIQDINRYLNGGVYIE